VLRSLLLAAVLTLASATAVLAQETSAWPMAGHDAARTGTVAGPSPPYAEVWRVEAPVGGPMTAPIATGDAVVLLGRTGIVALDPADGAILWEVGRSEGVAGTPAVAGDLVIYASGRGEDARLVGRALEDGRRAWSVPLGAPAFSAPAVEGDLLVVGTHDGRLLAFDTATGEERWVFEVFGAFDAAPTIADGLVIAAARGQISRPSILYAIDAEAGPAPGEVWRYSEGIPGLTSGAAAGDGFVAVGMSDQMVRAIGLENGDVRWEAETRDLFVPRQSPATPGDVVAADRSHVYRFDAATGEERWTFQISDLRALSGGRFNTLIPSGLAILGEAVLIGDGTGRLSAIDLDSGHRTWSRDLGDGSLSAPAADGTRVYVSELGEDGSVVALEHDPDARLTDEPSSTVLFPGRALLNFLLAAAGIGAAIVLLFRFAIRRAT
jgi:outer membrane protein assembly factor BamB